MGSAIGLVLLAVVAIGFAVKIMQIQARRGHSKPIQEAIKTDTIAFRATVRVKVQYSNGRWSRKTLGGLDMALIIGNESWHLVSKPGVAGRIFGNEWYFKASDTSMAAQQMPEDPLGLEWIVLTGSRDGQIENVAVSSDNGMLEMWGFLLRAGVQATSIPPLR